MPAASNVITAAGTIFAISAALPATHDMAGFVALTFTDIAEVVDGGSAGKTFNKVDHSPLATREVLSIKGSFGHGTRALQLGRDISDAGQALIIAQLELDTAASFKITYQNGDVDFFTATVDSYTDDIGTIDTTVGSSVSIAQCQATVRNTLAGAVFYTFNGSNQYVSIPAHNTLGDWAKYRTVAVNPITDIADIVDQTGATIDELGRVAGVHYAGPFDGVAITDSSPIQDTTYLAGDGAVNATLATEIFLPGEWDIEFDFIRHDRLVAGTAASMMLGATTDADRLVFNDSGNANPDRVWISQDGSARNIDNALAGVAEGQHATGKLTLRISGGVQTLSFYLDGDLSGTPAVLTSTRTFSLSTVFFSSVAATQTPNRGMAIQNLKVTDYAGGDFYEWGFDEGSTASPNKDITTGSAYDATWTSAATATEIGLNNRSYPMDEGGFSRLYDTVLRQNGTIENFTEGGWSVQKVIAAVNVFKDNFDLTTPTATASYFDFDFDDTGQYMYAARGSEGIAIFDISDPESVLLVGSNKRNSWGYRNVKRIGDYLFSVSRLNFGTDPEGGGSLERWDISDPSNPVLDTKGATVDGYYEVYHMTDKAQFSRYSAFDSDGTNIFVFGQHHGVFKFPVSDIESGPTDASGYVLDPDEDNTDWETQGGSVSGGRVSVANYGNADGVAADIRVLDATDLTVDIGTVARFTDVVVQRAWETVTIGDVMLSSHNSNDSNPETRGLMVLDMSGLSADQAHTDYLVYPAADVSPPQTSGDTPDTGMALFGDWLLVGHGRGGVAVFDVTRPLYPVYKGLINNLEGLDSVFGVNGFTTGGKEYLVYADGQQAATGDGTKKVYIDELLTA